MLLSEGNEREFFAQATGQVGVEQLAGVWAEREKTKRLLIVVAALLFIVASLVVVFAPADREKPAYVLGAALIVMSLGAIGVARFRIKLPLISVDTTGSAPHAVPAGAATNTKAQQTLPGHTMGL